MLWAGVLTATCTRQEALTGSAGWGGGESVGKKAKAKEGWAESQNKGLVDNFVERLFEYGCRHRSAGIRCSLIECAEITKNHMHQRDGRHKGLAGWEHGAEIPKDAEAVQKRRCQEGASARCRRRTPARIRENSRKTSVFHGKSLISKDFQKYSRISVDNFVDIRQKPAASL
jgi:hypothetical protein